MSANKLVSAVNSMPRLPGLASGSGPSSGPGLAPPRSSSVRDRSFVNAAATVAAAEFPRQPLAASCSVNAQAAMAGAFPSMTLYAAPVPAAVTNRWLHVAWRVRWWSAHYDCLPLGQDSWLFFPKSIVQLYSFLIFNFWFTRCRGHCAGFVVCYTVVTDSV